MTRSAPGLRQPTNSPPPLTRIGPDREICSAPWHPRSRWRSWSITRARKRPRIWERSVWVRSAVGTPTAAANPSGAARPAARSPGGTDRIAHRNIKCHRRRAGRSAARTASGDTNIERVIADRVAAHPRARLLEQLPGVGIINLAQLLAEIGPILDRVDTAEQRPQSAELRRSPRPRQNHRRLLPICSQQKSSQGNHRLRAHSRMQSRWAATLYADARARGKRNPHAIRILARAWIRIIWACWHSGAPYDPTNPASSGDASRLSLRGGQTAAYFPRRYAWGGWASRGRWLRSAHG